MDTPWGFIRTGEGESKLTCVATFKERQERADLGEQAIALLGLLGVPPVKIAKAMSSTTPLKELEDEAV